MLRLLPEFIEPLQLAEKKCTLEGHLPLERLTRLRESLSEGQGKIFLHWSFSQDDKLRPTVYGRLTGQLPMICQRCLKPMLWTFDNPVNLIIVPEQEPEEDDLFAEFEVITLQTPMSLYAMAEDELILALPIVAKHENCTVNTEQQLTDELPQRENPFQILATLKQRQ